MTASSAIPSAIQIFGQIPHGFIGVSIPGPRCDVSHARDIRLEHRAIRRDSTR